MYINSFIPWVGGKSQLRKEILALFPAEEPAKYVEVFGGAGWVLFARERHAAIEVFNDIDGNLINLYRCVQHHCSELQRELKLGGDQLLPNSREMFFACKEQLSTAGLTDIQRAARYYYLIRTSYGADRDSFCCTKRGLSASLDRLPEIQQRLQNVVIENRDFAAILKTYDKPGTLFYLDPPYYKAEGFYQGFSRDDHQRLADALAGIKSRFVLSYNDAPEIRGLYNMYYMHAVERANNLATAKGGKAPPYKELIITNY